MTSIIAIPSQQTQQTAPFRKIAFTRAQSNVYKAAMALWYRRQAIQEFNAGQKDVKDIALLDRRITRTDPAIFKLKLPLNAPLTANALTVVDDLKRMFATKLKQLADADSARRIIENEVMPALDNFRKEI